MLPITPIQDLSSWGKPVRLFLLFLAIIAVSFSAFELLTYLWGEFNCQVLWSRHVGDWPWTECVSPL